MEFKQYVSVKSHTKGIGTPQVFQAEVIPNVTLSGRWLYQRLAQQTNLSEMMAETYVKMIERFIKEELSHGNRIDFDLVSFYPRLSGSLSARDADPVSEGLYVRGAVKARKALLDAPRFTVEPENRLAIDRPRIRLLVDSVTESQTFIAPEHEIHIYGKNIPIVSTRSDEGIWLETRRQGRVYTAEVLSSTPAEAVCVFHGELAPRGYTLALGTRCGKSTDYRVRRCLWDVKVAR